jgi:hypothetical protein
MTATFLPRRNRKVWPIYISFGSARPLGPTALANGSAIAASSRGTRSPAAVLLLGPDTEIPTIPTRRRNFISCWRSRLLAFGAVPLNLDRPSRFYLKRNQRRGGSVSLTDHRRPEALHSQNLYLTDFQGPEEDFAPTTLGSP